VSGCIEKVALVTGATRGVGKGVARSLASAGYVVYGTGRSAADADLSAGIIGIQCDAANEREIARVVDRIASERGRLDVLVNSAWGGYERMVEDGRFTWGAPFWQQPLWRWDAMLTVGVRGAFVASQHAARLMIPVRQGLIAHVSHWAAQKHLGNVLYGMAKAATDKMAADMARELDAHRVTVVSIYPGLVRTEAVLAAGVFDLSNSESPEFAGRAVAALAGDPLVHRWTGQVLVAAAVALDYGFTDIDGKQPRPLTLSDV
jgi:NAD(P)-dependent dehydrogenase (short-subunit alcohol dehydrogenase family)